MHRSRDILEIKNDCDGIGSEVEIADSDFFRTDGQKRHVKVNYNADAENEQYNGLQYQG